VHLLWTFFSRWIQLLRRQRIKMGVYPRSSCPDHPSEELSAEKVDTRIHKVLDLGVNSNPGVDPVPLRRGIASAGVNTLGPISVAFTILSFDGTHDFVQGLGGVRGKPWEST
jgi:hypothetical protein